MDTTEDCTELTIPEITESILKQRETWLKCEVYNFSQQMNEDAQERKYCHEKLLRLADREKAINYNTYAVKKELLELQETLKKLTV